MTNFATCVLIERESCCHVFRRHADGSSKSDSRLDRLFAGGIAKQSAFVENPPALAFGMSVVLWLGTVIQLIASYKGLNVSATHCIIGGIIGMAMAWGGADAVYWAEPDRCDCNLACWFRAR